MIHRDSPPLGFHCTRFDTTLLKQVIALDIDIALHKAMREERKVFDGGMAHRWCEIVLQRILQDIVQEASAHCLLPQVIDRKIAEEIQLLLSGREQQAVTPDPAPVPHDIFHSVPFSFFWRPLLFFRRSFFQKHIE